MKLLLNGMMLASVLTIATNAQLSDGGGGKEGESEAKKCMELCVRGEWILDFWGDAAGAQVGDVLTVDFELGGAFKFEAGGGAFNQTFYVTDTWTSSYTMVDNGTNPSSIDQPVSGPPDGRIDPLWVMGSFSACMTVEVPASAALTATWQSGNVVATLNGNPVSVAFSFGTNMDPNTHTYTSPPIMTATQVDCIPEASTSLFGLIGALLLLRRKRA